MSFSHLNELKKIEASYQSIESFESKQTLNWDYNENMLDYFG